MTKNSFDKFRDVGSPLSEWTIPSEDGVHRRTIVKGAAWTIPVVAVAVATPAAAASETPTLAFTKASYAGTACGTITGVQVKRTTDGTAPDPGKTVTVTLMDGYTFADGSTTYTGTTDTNGLVTLPDIKVPSKGGDSNFGAKSDQLTTSAPVSADPSAKSGIYKVDTSTNTSTGPIANSGTAIRVISDPTNSSFVFQNKDGSIHDSNGDTRGDTASGVSTDPQLVATTKNTNSETIIWYKKSDGVYSYNANTKVTSKVIPNTSTTIKIIADAGNSSVVFQDSDGTIRDADGNVLGDTKTGVDTGTNLVSTTRSSSGDGSVTIWYKKSDGIYSYNAGTKVTTGPIANSAKAITFISDPTNSSFVFQDSDGAIRDSTGAIRGKTATGVKTDPALVATTKNTSGQTIIWYKTDAGVYSYNSVTDVTSDVIPNTKTTIKIVTDSGNDSVIFQNSDGSIRDSEGNVRKENGTGVDTGAHLVSTTRSSTGTGAVTVWYKKSPPCA